MIKTYSYSKDKDLFLQDHFQVWEFRSFNDATNTLTTDTILVDDNLTTTLEKLYRYLDSKYSLRSINITSGYRSSDFERYLSGNNDSFHVKGMASDIMCYKKDGSLISSKDVCLACEDLGINGIGYGTNYTHVDTRSYKSYFDETNGKTGIDSWYNYFNVRKDNVIYLKNPNYVGVSIVDALKGINIDSSYAYRSKLAIANNISNYQGTAEQNTYMLNLLKNGKLIKV